MFKFKQFSIQDGKSAMKIGTDGILLGCWVDISKANNILDVGTGTGVIAIMCAQKNHSSQIIAIEKSKLASEDAQANVSNSPWYDRIKVENGDFKQYLNINKLDHIISNPPFFESSLKAKDMSRNQARHADSLHYTDIFKFARTNLNKGGKISMILPLENAQEAIRVCEDYNLYASRICEVKPVPQKQPHRWLIELSNEKPKEIENTFLTIENGITRHEYTDQYIQLGKEFYLYF
jgi:tRNA1Val (adenine37-N6)-methyltransferase